MLSDDSPLKLAPVEYAGKGHPVWSEIYPEFVSDEFEEPEKMDVEFLRLLHKARKLAGVPFRILDTTRPDSHRSAHSELPCRAVDLQVLNTYERGRIIRACVAVGFVRFGIYEGSDGEYLGQKKRDGGGLHVDGSLTKPPAIWTMRRKL